MSFFFFLVATVSHGSLRCVCSYVCPLLLSAGSSCPGKNSTMSALPPLPHILHYHAHVFLGFPPLVANLFLAAFVVLSSSDNFRPALEASPNIFLLGFVPNHGVMQIATSTVSVAFGISLPNPNASSLLFTGTLRISMLGTGLLFMISVRVSSTVFTAVPSFHAFLTLEKTSSCGRGQ